MAASCRHSHVSTGGAGVGHDGVGHARLRGHWSVRRRETHDGVGEIRWCGSDTGAAELRAQALK